MIVFFKLLLERHRICLCMEMSSATNLGVYLVLFVDTLRVSMILSAI